jgi:hypothetical protein
MGKPASHHQIPLIPCADSAPGHEALVDTQSEDPVEYVHERDSDPFFHFPLHLPAQGSCGQSCLKGKSQINHSAQSLLELKGDCWSGVDSRNPVIVTTAE